MKKLVNDYRTLHKKNGSAEHIYSIHEFDDELLAVVLKESFEPRENYIPTTFGNRIGYSFYLSKTEFDLIKASDGYFKFIGTATLVFKSESTCYKFEEPVILEDIYIQDKQNFGKGYGSLIMTDIIMYCKEKNMRTIKGIKSFRDIDTSEKYKHWRSFYVERWGFTEAENEIILNIPD